MGGSEEGEREGGKGWKKEGGTEGWEGERKGKGWRDEGGWKGEGGKREGGREREGGWKGEGGKREGRREGGKKEGWKREVLYVFNILD